MLPSPRFLLRYFIPSPGSRKKRVRKVARAARRKSDEVAERDQQRTLLRIDPLSQVEDPAMPWLEERYQFIRRIGGNMGALWVAWDHELRRLVVIKHTVTVSDSCPHQRVCEAQTLALFNEEGICKVYDHVESGFDCYTVMEYIDGPSLGEWLDAHGPASFETAAWDLITAAEAVHRMHRKGVIHRDIKPDNFVLKDGAKIVLVDVGLALQMAMEPRLTQIGTFKGSPAYCSPEQAQASLELDARSDVYSLGVTGFELLTGHIPFQGTCEQVRYAHVCQSPPLFSKFDIHEPELERVCRKAMAKAPSDRYPSALDFAEAVREAIVAKRARLAAKKRKTRERKRKAAKRWREEATAHANLLLKILGCVAIAAVTAWLTLAILRAPVETDTFDRQPQLILRGGGSEPSGR